MLQKPMTALMLLLVLCGQFALLGCASRPLGVGGGLLVPGDGDLKVGWQLEFHPHVTWFGEGFTPLRVFGGSTPAEGGDGALNRVALALPLPPLTHRGESVELWLGLEVGGGAVWSADCSSAAPAVGVRHDILRCGGHSPWGVLVSYDWMPVDTEVGGHNVSEGGGLFLTARFNW